MRIAISTVWACFAVSSFAGQSGTNESAIPFGGETGNAPIQYFTPGTWAAITNGLSLSQLRDLAASPQNQAARSLATRLAASAGLPPSAIPAISAAAAQVLATQTPSAGNPQPLTAMSGSTLVNTHVLNIDFGEQSGVEVGPAAVGQNSSDHWNGIYAPWSYNTQLGTLLWSDQTQSGISGSIVNAPGDWVNQTAYNNDKMFGTYTYIYGQSITITLTGVPAGTYNLYLYGHGPTTDNSIFTVISPANNLGTMFTSTSTSWQSSTWTLGAQYVVFVGLTISSGQSLTIVVSPDSLNYALVAGLQLVPVNSVAAATLLNIDFGGSMSSPETGPAAAGVAQNNYWNYLGNLVPGPIWCLTEPDGLTLTPVSLTASGFSGSWSDGSTEPMYAAYIYPYPPFGNSGTLTLKNLPAGTCNVYAYSFDGNFQLALGNNNLGTRTTACNYPAVNPPPWVQNLHYALWQNVTIVPGQPLVLTVSPGTQGYAVISGMQISYTQPYQYPMQPNTQAWSGATAQQIMDAETVPAAFYTAASSDQLFNTVISNPKFRFWGSTSSSTYLNGYELAKYAFWGSGLIACMENSASLGTTILNWLHSLNLDAVDANNGLQFGNYAAPCVVDLQLVYYMASLPAALQTGNPASLFKLAAWDANHYIAQGFNTMAAAPTWVIYTIYTTYKSAVPAGITLPALSNDDSNLLQMGVLPDDLVQAISGLPSALGLSSRPSY